MEVVSFIFWLSSEVINNLYHLSLHSLQLLKTGFLDIYSVSDNLILGLQLFQFLLPLIKFFFSNFDSLLDVDAYLPFDYYIKLCSYIIYFKHILPLPKMF